MIDYRKMMHLYERGVSKNYLTLSFMKNRENLVFWGNPGTGKSWLAKMIATAACMANKRLRWMISLSSTGNSID